MIKEGIKTFKFIKEFKNLQSAQDDVSRKKALLFIKDLLGNEGGLLIKLLQYMGTKKSDIDEVLRTNDADRSLGISTDEAYKIFKAKYPDQCLDFSDFSINSFPASVGQVHRATLKNETSVAIKIQYPQIKKILKEQLKLLSMLPTLTKVTDMRKWSLDLNSYLTNLEKMIDQECDYTHEFSELIKWKGYLSPYPFCHVPEVYEQYAQRDIYVQEFIEGVYLNDVVKEWSRENKDKLGYSLVQVYFHLLFNHQCAQGDTNFGNFIFNIKENEPVINFIDLGQSFDFSTNFVKSLKTALKNEISNIEYSRITFLKEIGFDESKLRNIPDKVDGIIEILFEPFKVSRVYNLNDWNYKQDLDKLLGEDKWWFRSAGGSEFFFFMKSFMGLKNIISQLDIEINYTDLMRELIK